MAVEGDYIYWTDIHHNTVNRALKSSGNEQIRLAEGAEPVSSVIVVKKSQLRRRGDLFLLFYLYHFNKGADTLSRKIIQKSPHTCGASKLHSRAIL